MGVGHLGTVEAQCLLSGLGSSKFDEAVSSITTHWLARSETLQREQQYSPRVAITNDLHLDVLTKDSLKDLLDEILVHPGFHLAHPEGLGGLVRGWHGRLDERSVLRTVRLVATGSAVEVGHSDLQR